MAATGISWPEDRWQLLIDIQRHYTLFDREQFQEQRWRSIPQEQSHQDRNKGRGHVKVEQPGQISDIVVNCSRGCNRQPAPRETETNLG